jgi:hypothetical protein
VPGRNFLMALLMIGERLEHWRSNAFGRLVPAAAWDKVLDRHPLLNPAGAIRSGLAACFAPLEARETYRRPADGDKQ